MVGYYTNGEIRRTEYTKTKIIRWIIKIAIDTSL